MPEALRSKRNLDKVESINEKPSAVTEGQLNKNPDLEESVRYELDNHIVSDTPNLYKPYDVSMSEKGFLALSRDFLKDPAFNGMRISYQRLFLIMAREAVWKKTKWDISHHEVWLMPGQLCASYKWLAEKYNEDLRFDEDKIDKALVQRSVSVFLQLHFAIQESIHNKSVFTILIPMTYVFDKSNTDTDTDTKPIRNRYANKQSNKNNKSVSYLRSCRS